MKSCRNISALPPSSGQNLVRFPDPFADGSFKVRRGPCLNKTQKTAVFSQESVPCAPRLHCFIGRAWQQMDQKGQYLAPNDQRCIFWAKFGRFGNKNHKVNRCLARYSTTNQPTNRQGTKYAGKVHVCANKSMFWGKNGCFWAKHPNFFVREQKFI